MLPWRMVIEHYIYLQRKQKENKQKTFRVVLDMETNTLSIHIFKAQTLKPTSIKLFLR